MGNAVFRTIFLLLSVQLEYFTEAVSTAGACTDECQLPGCYCDTYAIPGGLHPMETPQMVLFTLNDPVTSATRTLLADAFPDKLQNPVTGCPIAITVFVVGSGRYVTRLTIGALYHSNRLFVTEYSRVLYKIAAHLICYSFVKQNINTIYIPNRRAS